MNDRKLSLKREALTELASDDLRHVVGGTASKVGCYTGITDCKLCDILPTNRGCTPTPDA